MEIKIKMAIMTKKRIIKMVVFVIMLLIIIGLVVREMNPNPVKGIEFYIDFKLPTDMEVLYNYQPTGFAQGGRNYQYTVFKLKERPDSFLSENKFTEVPIEKIYETPFVIARFIPEEFQPPRGEECIQKSSHPVYLLYFETRKWLITIVVRD